MICRFRFFLQNAFGVEWITRGLNRSNGCRVCHTSSFRDALCESGRLGERASGRMGVYAVDIWISRGDEVKIYSFEWLM